MPVLLANLVVRAVNSPADLPCNGNPSDLRALWEILWSCVVTIFACTWITVHPNIPAADDTRLMVAFRRARLMLCGLVAPEIIIMWAMRQWYSARKIAQAHKERGWTISHGFFLQMGGFMMHDGMNPPYPIQLPDLVARCARGEIEWPDITETEIRDKSKGDAFSKGIVIIQTSWFLIQCIGRWATGLAITELELVTLAFAALNAVTYFFWWNKPADVRCAHPIYLKGQLRRHGHTTHTASESTGPRNLGEHLSWLIRFIWVWLEPIIPPIYQICQRGSPLTYIVGYIQRPAIFLMKNVILPMAGNMNNMAVKGRVQTFYAAEFKPNSLAFFLMTLACAFIGSAFGGIHCIAWSFPFPSGRDQMLWRASSLVITFTPFVIALPASNHMASYMLKGFIIPEKHPQSTLSTLPSPASPTPTLYDLHPNEPATPGNASITSSQLRQSNPPIDRAKLIARTPEYIPYRPTTLWHIIVRSIKCILLVGITATYATARIILLIEALMALRTSSGGALQRMEWTNLIPHVE